ncbi:hypothetical protein AK812_SmicGene33995 [Symbiodinium microadriaticum]|uniref:Uncharacterized protein n=1 Tax=Symbiodinium microadriaticum TaxID=2951 RepID=A0A1Q9CQ59_SYMMI|nr:hypothetical protein AK812_SmicGene33995 [Symbiodinium microadriaticum]
MLATRAASQLPPECQLAPVCCTAVQLLEQLASGWPTIDWTIAGGPKEGDGPCKPMHDRRGRVITVDISHLELAPRRHLTASTFLFDGGKLQPTPKYRSAQALDTETATTAIAVIGMASQNWVMHGPGPPDPPRASRGYRLCPGHPFTANQPGILAYPIRAVQDVDNFAATSVCACSPLSTSRKRSYKRAIRLPGAGTLADSQHARTSPDHTLAVSRAYHVFKQAHKDLQFAANSGDARALNTHVGAKAALAKEIAAYWPYRIVRKGAKLLQQQLRPYAVEYLKDVAQFAYLPNRDASMAIQRVADHCSYVQKKCSHAYRTVADRQEHLPKPEPHFAGLQLSLDLSSDVLVLFNHLLHQPSGQTGYGKSCVRLGIYNLVLWKATILPTLMYGLAAVTPDANDVHRMQEATALHKRLRLLLEEAVIEDLPLIRWTLPQSKRTSLLTDTKVHAYLLHCFQWAATPTAVKCHMTVQHPEWKSGPKQSICSGVFADTSLCPAGIVNKCILILTATGLNVLSLVPVLFWKSIIAMANADMDVDAQEALFFGQSPSKPGPTDGHGDAPLHEERRNGDGAGAVRYSSQVEDHEGRGARKLSYSLKLALFKQLLVTMHERLSETFKTPTAMERAKSLGWIDSDQHRLTLKWKPMQQALEVDTSTRAVPTTDLLSQLAQMRRAINEEILLRFRSIRHLSPAVKAEWIQFQLVVSFRPEAAPVWSALQGWIERAAWHVLGCRSRRDRRLPSVPTHLLGARSLAVAYQATNQLHSQHDAAELITYLLPRLQLEVFDSSWEARLHVAGDIRVADTGPLLAPITLAPVPGEQLILPSMIDQWHAQASIHALKEPSTVVCMQLQRFLGNAGIMQRDSRLLLGYQCTVHLPVFCNSATTEVSHVPYQAVAMQLHYGEQPTSGHYRTIMIGQPLFGKDRMWLTEDGCTPEPIQREHDSAIYLLWLIQAPATIAN